MDRRAGRVLFSRLQPPGFLPIIKGDHRKAVRREAAEVHLHVLGVVHLDPVQEDAHVFAAETPDIDGLEAATWAGAAFAPGRYTDSAGFTTG